jgi:hypothetical protein
MIVVLKKNSHVHQAQHYNGIFKITFIKFQLIKKNVSEILLIEKYFPWNNLYDQAQNIFGQNSTQQTHPNKSWWSSEKVQGFNSKMPSSCRSTRLPSIQL